MKHTLLCFLVLGIFSCTKENLPVTSSVIGKWTIASTFACTESYEVNDPAAFIEFRSNGDFVMNASPDYYAYQMVCQNFNRYRVQNEGEYARITLYNTTNTDTREIVLIQQKIHISAGLTGNVFIKGY